MRKQAAQLRSLRELIKAAYGVIDYARICGERQAPGTFGKRIGELEAAVEKAEKALK